MVLEIEVHSPFGPKSPVEFEPFESTMEQIYIVLILTIITAVKKDESP